MPALKKLKDSCAVFPLDHGADRLSGLAWEHVSTGQGPQKSGRWSAVSFDPIQYEVSQTPTSNPPFTAGLPIKAVVFDAPYFDLCRAPNTQGLVSWGAHDPGTRPQSNPLELADELRTRFGEYAGRDYIYAFTWPNIARTQHAGEALARAVEQRAAITRWLLTQRLTNWDLALVVMSEFHSIIEPMWHGLDPHHALHTHPSAEASDAAVRKVYRSADKFFAMLTDLHPDASIVAFSMHGMGPNHADVPSMLLLPELLYRRRFGRSLFQPLPSWENGNPPLLEPDQVWEPTVLSCLCHSRHGKFAALRRLLGIADQIASPTHNLAWMPTSHYARYWPRMDAFALPSFYDGRIRINLRGREGRGNVIEKTYDKICDQLETMLKDCRDAITGEYAVRQVMRRSFNEAIALNTTESDIHVVWNGPSLGLNHPKFGRIGPAPIRRTGGHTGGHGIAYIRDSRLRKGSSCTRSSFDVVPTILSILGLEKPSHFSGRSILAS
jgi:predicted AlkP superfamily phosphohydrolase/phosphomutase